MNQEELIKYFENKINIFSEKISELESQNNLYKKRCEQYAIAYESLLQEIRDLKRYRFGKKSEKFIEDECQQMDIFSLPLEPLSTEVAPQKNIAVTAHQRVKKKTRNQELPRRIEIIPVSDADKQCTCGQTKTLIRYETKELLHYQPAVFEIIEQRREVVACPNECENTMKTAPAPTHCLSKTKVTEAFLAFLIVSKLQDRQPLYHLEKNLESRYGINCSRQTMARWLIELIKPLQPLYNLIKDECIAYDIASVDATMLQVLQEPGRRPETKSYIYCICGGPPDKSIILYDYNCYEHKFWVKNWFDGFQGYIHVDGDAFFERLGQTPGINLVHCHAHARRKFEPIAKEAKNNKGLAQEVLRQYKAIYRMERLAKESLLTSEQRYVLRQKELKPLLDKFKQWLDKAAPTVLPQSPLGKAIAYCQNHWFGLYRVLNDGRLQIDNNHTEREIKPFVIARKNFLFAASVDGAKALCMHFSLIRTAKLHGLDPYHYYVQLLKNIPLCQSIDDYEQLLPWNMQHIMAGSAN